MKRWSYGYNSQTQEAIITLQEVPLWVELAESVVGWLCKVLPNWQVLPPIPITREWVDGEVMKTNLHAWYGGLGSLFHSYVCCPVTEVTERHWVELAELRLPVDTVRHLNPGFYANYADEEEEPRE